MKNGNLEYRQMYATSPSADMWRFLRRGIWFVLMLLVLLFGRDANAVTVSMGGSVVDKGSFRIDEVATVWVKCAKGFLETRYDISLELNGQVLNSADYYSSFDWGGPLSAEFKISDHAKPGEKRSVKGYCSGSSTADDGWRSFSVLPLKGTAEFSTKKGMVIVNGTVGNGANRVVVHVDGKPVAEKNDLTSGYTIEAPVSPGMRNVDVYVHYKEHSLLIAAISGLEVDEAPTVSIAGHSKFTNKSEITLKGQAESKAGVKEAWYDWEKPDGSRTGAYISVHPGKDIGIQQNVAMGTNGKHRFRLWAKAEDDQAEYSNWISTMLDTKRPMLENQTEVNDGFIGKDTTVRVKVRDYDSTGAKIASGIDSVMIEVTDKNNKKSGWKDMNLLNGTTVEANTDAEGKTIYEGDYAYSLDGLFEGLADGDVRIDLWASDRAGNSDYLKTLIYKKAEQPTASLAAAKAITNAKDGRIELDIKADADVKIKNMWLEVSMVDKDEKSFDFKLLPLDFTAGKNVAFKWPYAFPQGDGKYLFNLIAKAEDGQQNDMRKMETVSVIYDTTNPTAELLSPDLKSKLKSDTDVSFKVEDKNGSGVASVSVRICQGGKCGEYDKAIPNDGAGVYTKKLSIDELESGPFILWVEVDDKAGNGIMKSLKFIKELTAADVLTTEMSFGEADGRVSTGPFYFGETRRMRLFVDAKTGSKGVTVAYSLPDGLSLAGKAVLKGKFSAALAGAGKQVENWTGNGNLLTDIDIGEDERIVIDIPVKMTRELARQKVGIDGQVTSFEVTGKEFDGTARAETTWRADWKKEPADVNSPVMKEFDLSTPEDIILFDKVSGGYDTAEPAKWNRNTLHCRGDQAACQKFPDYTGIKLRFTEQASQKTVHLNLRGKRDQTLAKDGRPTRGGSLDVQANPGAEAGVDAEARFSVTIPKSELARLPSDGQWRAELIMDMKDAAGKNLAAFTSDIMLDVTDRNDMSLKPPRLELLEGSHQDNNGSGGFTANDEFVYRVTYVASRDLNDVNLELALPPGLDRSENLRHAEGSVRELLSTQHGKSLLQHPINLRQGQQLVIDVPLRIAPDGAARLVSRVHAHAEGFDPLPSAEAVLNVQRRFDVSEGLGMTLTMLDQSGAGPEPVVAQQTPLTYRIVLSSRKHALQGLSLNYRLPGGMRLAAGAKPVLAEVPQLGDVKLNPLWDGDADTALFADGARLPKEESVAIDIPVMVKEIVEDGVSVQSTFSAGAANLSGELSKSHKIRTRERESGGGHRVRIVKSVKGDAVALPGAEIRYQIRVSNQTFKTVRNLLIRDRAPDHTTLIDASCGDLPDSACRVLKLGDKAVEEGTMTHAALCKGGAQSDPEGQHVFWCLDGDLEPLADYVVDYAVRINDGSAAAP